LEILKVAAIRAFADNYIWVIHAPGAFEQVVVVDPGDALPVLHTLKQQQLTLRGILATHHHGDHVGGVVDLLTHSDVPFFGPATEQIPGSPQRLSEGQRAQFAELGLDFAVFDVPGHTAGHIAYVGHGALFCGDTLFSAGCGRLFEGTAAQMTSSLQKLARLPTQTAVYCGHEYTLSNLRFAHAVEPDNVEISAHLNRCVDLGQQGQATLPSTLGLELSINPFLRLTTETVKQAAEQHAARTLDSETEVFAVLREWKNNFRN
jgi:hydroxyacylglutathione hydrolase